MKDVFVQPRDKRRIEIVGDDPEAYLPRHYWYQPRRGTLSIPRDAKDEPSKPPPPRPPGVVLL